MMHLKIKLNMAFAVLIVLVLSSISCDMSGDSVSSDEYGNLQLITPLDWDFEVVSIQVLGEDGSGRSFEVTVPVSTSPVYISNILSGPWTITAFALNDAGDQILAGQKSVLIEAGETNEISISLSALEGTGTLIVEFRWPVGALSNPAVSAYLSRYLNDDSIGDPVELVPFTASEVEGTEIYRYEGVHDTGYYFLDTQVLDDSGTPWENSDAVLITAGNEVPVSIDLETGAVNIQIVIEESDPLDVTLSTDTLSPISLGTDMTINASVNGGTLPYTYRWYLNGSNLEEEAGSSIVLGSGLTAGRYRLTLIASDGDVLGSDTIVFDIMP